MKEWFLNNLDIYGITALVSALGSLVAMIVCLVRTHKANKVLSEAKARKTQIICPKCKKKSPIDEVHFVLPDGALDDNLNGVPDNQE